MWGLKKMTVRILCKCIPKYCEGLSYCITCVDWKNTRNLRDLYSVGIFRTSSLGDSISSENSFWGGEGKSQVIYKFAAGGGGLNKSLLLIKENQVSQIKKFSTRLCMGRCKRLGSLNLFLSCVSQLSGAKSCCMIIHVFKSPFHLGSGGCGGWLPLALSCTHLPRAPCPKLLSIYQGSG